MTWSARLERLKPVLACPRCGGGLAYRDDAATCAPCGADYPVRGGQIFFVEVPERTDDLDSFKGILKQWLGPAYYTLGVRVLAPTYPFDYVGQMRRWLDPERQLVVDAGCGNHRIDAHVICADLFNYSAVDVVCDLAHMPFKTGGLDAVISRSLLEHVPDPWRVVEGFRRATRTGGLGLHLVPFLFPFHAAPHDYHRFTSEGLKRLFGGWQVVEQFNATGPVTLWLLTTTESLATLLALGRERPKALCYLLLCGLLFPLKYLDVFFVRKASFLGMAPSIFTVIRKAHDDAAS